MFPLVEDGMPWFPQQYAELFYYVKGAVALVAVGLLLLHMRYVRAETLELGRWLRYLALLYFAVLLAGSSVEQVSAAVPVNYRNLFGLVGAVVLIVAVSISISESRGKR